MLVIFDDLPKSRQYLVARIKIVQIQTTFRQLDETSELSVSVCLSFETNYGLYNPFLHLQMINIIVTIWCKSLKRLFLLQSMLVITSDTFLSRRLTHFHHHFIFYLDTISLKS